jgi:cell division initiation protein
MKIAPIDIVHKNFKSKWMGADHEEVAEFLRAISEELEIIIKERNDLRERLREKELALLEFKERDQVLKDTITTAHKMAENIRHDAEREAKLILNDAQQKGEFIVKDARDSLKKIYQEINDLKRVRIGFETRLRSLLTSYISILDEENKTFLEPAEPR